MNKTISTTGRIIFALPLAAYGLMHFAMTSMMAQYVVPKWLPAGEFFVYLTGAALLAAAVSLFINKFTHLAGLGLFLFMLVLLVTVHIPGISNPDQNISQMAMTMTLKDTIIMGAS